MISPVIMIGPKIGAFILNLTLGSCRVICKKMHSYSTVIQGCIANRYVLGFSIVMFN